MRRIKMWAAAAVFGLSFIGRAFGQTAGDEVVVIVKQTELKHEATVVETIYRGNYLKVREVNGNWLWVDTDGTRGWLNRDHVILASRAIEYFSDELRRNPRDSTAMCARAIAWKQKDELTNAIRDCTDAIAINSRSAWAFKIRGTAWRAKGEYDLAIADYDEGIRLSPSDSQVYNFRGDCHYAKKNYDKAIADYTEAIRLNPKWAVAFGDRGDSYRAKEQDDKALADYTMAIELDPKNTRFLTSRAYLWNWRKNDHDKAIADYSQAIAIDPRNAHAYECRAGIWEREKHDFKRAADDYMSSLAIKPEDGFTHLQLGWIYEQTGELDRAIGCFEKSLQLKGAYGRSSLARVYIQQQQYSKASELLEQELAGEPDSSSAKRMVADFLATCPDGRFRDGKRAVALATEALAIATAKGPIFVRSYQRSLAAAYAESGEFTKATELQKELLEKANDSTRNDCEARLKLYESGQPYRDTPKVNVGTTTAAK